MTDEAMRAAAEAFAIAAHNELRQSYEAAGMASPPETYKPYPNPNLLRAAIVAFLKAWEPSEEAVKALLTAYCTTAADERGSVRAMLRAEAERMERGG